MGQVIYSDDSPDYPAWYAFNNDKNLYPYGEILPINNQYYLGYETSDLENSLNGYFIEFMPDGKPDSFGIEISKNGIVYEEIYRKNSNIQNIESGILNNYNNYKYFRYQFYINNILSSSSSSSSETSSSSSETSSSSSESNSSSSSAECPTRKLHVWFETFTVPDQLIIYGSTGDEELPEECSDPTSSSSSSSSNVLLDTELISTQGWKYYCVEVPPNIVQYKYQVYAPTPGTAWLIDIQSTCDSIPCSSTPNGPPPNISISSSSSSSDSSSSSSSDSSSSSSSSSTINHQTESLWISVHTV